MRIILFIRSIIIVEVPEFFDQAAIVNLPLVVHVASYEFVKESCVLALLQILRNFSSSFDDAHEVFDVNHVISRRVNR